MTSRAAAKAIAFVGFEERTLRVRPGVQLPGSSLASTRLRVHIPAVELARRFPVYMVSFKDFLADPHLGGIGGARAVVFRKLSSNEVLARTHTLHYMVEQLRALAAEVRVVADLSDDFSSSLRESRTDELADYQNELLQTCAISVPCQALAERLAGAARHGVQVIEDPFEGPEVAARAPAREKLRICWFGNAIQLDQVTAALAAVAARFGASEISVEIVSSRNAFQLFADCGQELSGRYPGFALRFTEWSRESVWRALAACDLVLLPQDPSVPWGQVKSHNRLVEAIRAGRLAIASPIASYRELAEYAWVGDDLCDGLAWALANPQQVLERVRTGQALVRERFAPATVAGKWATALELAS